MQIQLCGSHQFFFLLDIHSNLVPKQNTLTNKNYRHIYGVCLFMKKNNKEEILVTILPIKGIIGIKCWRLMKLIFEYAVSEDIKRWFIFSMAHWSITYCIYVLNITLPPSCDSNWFSFCNLVKNLISTSKKLSPIYTT